MLIKITLHMMDKIPSPQFGKTSHHNDVNPNNLSTILAFIALNPSILIYLKISSNLRIIYK